MFSEIELKHKEKFMKSVVSKLVLSAFVTTMFANIVMADGSAFTPLNFDDTAYTPAYSTTSTSAQTPKRRATKVCKVLFKNSTPLKLKSETSC